MITHVRITHVTGNYTSFKMRLAGEPAKRTPPVSSAEFPLVETLKVSFRAESLLPLFILLLRHSAIHVAQL